MSWNTSVRRAHRWLSLAFTVGVVVNLVALRHGAPSAWVGCSALLPLALLEFTGLLLLVQPYAVAWRRRRGGE